MNWSEFFHQFSLETSGYFYMWAILFFLILVIAIIIERAICIWIRSNINAPRFWAEIHKLASAGDFKKAIALCRSAGNKALPQVVLRCLEVAEHSEMIDFRSVQNAVDEASLEVMPKLVKRTNWLAQLGNVATLTGLLGTIFGLIQSFGAIGAAGANAAILSQGIAIAMYTTLFGLTVAIPALLAYTMITNKTQDLIDDIDEYSVKLIHLLTGAR